MIIYSLLSEGGQQRKRRGRGRGLCSGRRQDRRRCYKWADMIQQQWQQAWDNVSKLFFPHSHLSISRLSVHGAPVIQSRPLSLTHTSTLTQNVTRLTQTHTYRYSDPPYITLYYCHLNTNSERLAVYSIKAGSDMVNALQIQEVPLMVSENKKR